MQVQEVQSITRGARRARRERTFRGATIVHGEELLTVECTVHDRSAGGLRIKLPPLTALPSQFWLLEHRSTYAHEVSLRWRRENDAGLQIVGGSDLAGARSPECRVLRGVWAEKAPR